MCLSWHWWISCCFTQQRFWACGVCLSADWTGAPPSPPYLFPRATLRFWSAVHVQNSATSSWGGFLRTRRLGKSVLVWLSSCCCLPLWLGCLRFGLLSLGSLPSPSPWLSSGVFWSSQLSAGPPDIWLYLQRSGWHTAGMACRGWLAPVFTPLHGNKGFGPVWALPSSTPCGGCCAPRSGTEVFALGWSRIPLGNR